MLGQKIVEVARLATVIHLTELDRTQNIAVGAGSKVVAEPKIYGEAR